MKEDGRERINGACEKGVNGGKKRRACGRVEREYEEIGGSEREGERSREAATTGEGAKGWRSEEIVK